MAIVQADARAKPPAAGPAGAGLAALLATVPAFLMAAALVLLVTASTAAAKPKPDLVVSSLSPPAVAGGTLQISEKTKNTGSAKAAASSTAYFLSLDGARDPADLSLGKRSVGSLAPGKGSAAKRTLQVPAPALSGASYFLLACADSGRVVRERKERNNCRSSGPIVIGAIGDTPVVPSPPNPGPGSGSGPGGGSDPDPPAAPAAPTGLSATTVSESEIELDWAAASGATTYQVRRGTNSSGPFSEVATVTSPGYLDTSLTQNITYYYVVRAANAGGSSADSSVSETTTDFECTDSVNGSPVVMGAIDGDNGSGSLSQESSLCRGDVDSYLINVVDSDHCDGLACGTISARFKLEMGLPRPGRDIDLDLCVFQGATPMGCSEKAGNATEEVTVQWTDVGGPDDTKALTARVDGFTSTTINTYKLTVLGNVIPD